MSYFVKKKKKLKLNKIKRRARKKRDDKRQRGSREGGGITGYFHFICCAFLIFPSGSIYSVYNQEKKIRMISNSWLLEAKHREEALAAPVGLTQHQKCPRQIGPPCNPGGSHLNTDEPCALSKMQVSPKPPFPADTAGAWPSLPPTAKAC